MIGKITELIDQPKRDCIYDILQYMTTGLCVDIGAAAGHITRRICLACGPDTRVVAFEPFPGNHGYFDESTNTLENNIRLVKKAVSDTTGTAEFVVSSVVQGTEPGWEKYLGYSSVGFLSSAKDTNGFKFDTKILSYLKSKIKSIIVRIMAMAPKFFTAILRKPCPQILKVETTTIKDEFPDETIDFMKIDVQGAEAQVLQGAHSLLQDGRIKVLYIEWSGEKDVVEILANHGYHIYDSTYVGGSKSRSFEPFNEIGFDCVDEVNLSTGNQAYEMILKKPQVSPDQAINLVLNRDIGWIQTDLIAVAPKTKKEFLTATKRYITDSTK